MYMPRAHPSFRPRNIQAYTDRDYFKNLKENYLASLDKELKELAAESYPQDIGAD